MKIFRLFGFSIVVLRTFPKNVVGGNIFVEEHEFRDPQHMTLLDAKLHNLRDAILRVAADKWSRPHSTV